MPTAIHRFVWHDLNTTDVAAAEAFYGKVFGWTANAHDPHYKMWQNGEKGLGGVCVLKEEAKAMGAPPHWLAYVGVADAAATVAKAESLGARVYVPATAIPQVGRFAVIADPTGAVFAVYESARELGEQPQAGVGDFSWGELYTGDVDAAWAFYSGLFGWEKDDMDMGEMGMYRLFKNPDMGTLHMGGMCGFPPGMPPHPAWLYYASVADIHATVATVKSLGGQVLNGPMEVPGGDLIAQCLDPQGAAFALHQRPA
jgi:predicted enzyme related to lactoylglutathione lyase